METGDFPNQYPRAKPFASDDSLSREDNPATVALG